MARGLLYIADELGNFYPVVGTLDSLPDVDISSIQDGYVLVWSVAQQKWIAAEVSGGPGGGDMLKSTYDTDDDGAVNNAEALNGHADTYFATASALSSHTGNTSNPHSVTKTQVSLGNVENLKVNLTAVVAPTVDDDSGDGYAVGSRWINTNTDKEYVCTDSTVGAAVWVETTSAAGSIAVEEDGTEEGAAVNRLNFTGDITVTVVGSEAEINVVSGGQGQITVKESDDSPEFTGVTTLIVGAGDLSQPSANIVRIKTASDAPTSPQTQILELQIFS